jgi:hypothetical protein
MIHFRSASRSSYGIASPRRHLNEFSKRDLLRDWKREQEWLMMYGQPVEDWARMPQVIAATTPREEHAPMPIKLAKGAQRYRDLRTDMTGVRLDIGVQIATSELWTLSEKNSAQTFWNALNELLGGTDGTEPAVWVEHRPSLENGAWYVIHNGKRWDGETLVDMGKYDVRARLRGDADVKKDPPGHPMKTRKQAAAAAAEKANAPPPKPIVSAEALQKMMPPKTASESTPSTTTTPPSKNPSTVVQPKRTQALPPPKSSPKPIAPSSTKETAPKEVATSSPKEPAASSQKLDAQTKKPPEKPPATPPVTVTPKQTKSLEAVVVKQYGDSFVAETPDMRQVLTTDKWSNPRSMASSSKLANVMKEHAAPSRLDLVVQVPTSPAVIDLTNAAEHEAQRGNQDAANLVRACEAGVVRDNGAPPPPGIVDPPVSHRN